MGLALVDDDLGFGLIMGCLDLLYSTFGDLDGFSGIGPKLGRIGATLIIIFLWGPKMDQLSIEFNEVAHLRGS